MTTPIATGNAFRDTTATRGWLAGAFPGAPIPTDPATRLEIKVTRHDPGDRRPDTAPPDATRTVALLVDGTGFVITFPDLPDGPGAVEMTEPGAFVTWGPGVAHGWHATDHCMIITVRWTP